MDLHVAGKKLADLEVALPGFTKMWRAIKADTGTRVRTPSLTFTDQPRPMYLDDRECGRRYGLDLATMELSPGVHVSAGEWAVHAQHNPDGAVQDIPGGSAVVDCAWNDHYHYFSVTLTVPKGCLPQPLPAKEAQ